MQNKTSSGPRGSSFQNPLTEIVGMDSIRTRAGKCLGGSPRAEAFIDPLCLKVERIFAGELWAFQPINLHYHDYNHTLEASYVFLEIVEASRRHLPEADIPLPREMELGLAAILLHDTGYLKRQGDAEGTGAKYTHCHVLRSTSIAASLLPTLGCTLTETDDVIGAIRCTGLNGNPPKTKFSTPNARLVACMVATADYIGQMAAPDYPAKLPFLYDEFEEADTFSHVPVEKRVFRSVKQLLSATPSFWEKFVIPKLGGDFGGVFRLLATPYPDGPNHYLHAIEENIAAIAAQSSTPAAS